MMEDVTTNVVDPDYEFSAPRFFDFIQGETHDQILHAQLWFDTALTYAPSPFMHKVKTTRALEMESLCDFTQPEISHMDSESTTPSININSGPEKQRSNEKTENSTAEKTENDTVENKETGTSKKENNNKKIKIYVYTPQGKVGTSAIVDKSKTTKSSQEAAPTSTPKPQIMDSQMYKNLPQTVFKNQQTARRNASAVKNPSVFKSKNQLQPEDIKTPTVVRKAPIQSLNKVAATPNLAQEHQAIKRQKLEDGKKRQILNIKSQIFHHKERSGVFNGSNSNLATPSRSRKEERKMYVREPTSSVPFISMAEMMKKFQSGTRDMNLPPRPSSISNGASQVIQKKPKLTLTRPKEPSFETSQRVRSVKLKSSAEIEEEMMAKIPKFKARPVNRKILDAPTLPAMKRSTPQLPEFHEFHLETMERANQNAETSTVTLTEAAPHIHQRRPQLTTPKTPTLQTLLRARPTKIKSTEELEKEELERAPKFKARPLNKKIFESKGELGLFCNQKRQVTVPQEFHFAIDKRIPAPMPNVADMFDKLSLCSETSETNRQRPFLRNTAPNPFHLKTEERGAEKEKRFVMEVINKQIEDEQARIPKATPYPYTTDYPVFPPKPEPKQCTKPEPFQLESLARHEEEIQREREERRRLEEEDARLRIFKAQPILKEDPIPVPEKLRRPLTEIQEFNLHVEHRAVDRAEFDQKVKEKEMMYKRYRDEAECAKMMEEEKALKQLRRTLVPHARPVPNFNKPFLPKKSSRGVTKPRSPRLKVAERRKMVMAAATSSSASNMR